MAKEGNYTSLDRIMDPLQFWAKTNRDYKNKDSQATYYHPLLFHMLDVSAVAGLVWDHWIPPQLRKKLECSLGTDVRSQMMFLSGAHDLGKASPGFQKKVPELTQNFELQFSQNDQYRPHGFISTHILKEVLGSDSASAILAQIAGGHHGVFPRATELRMGRDTLGNDGWKKAREELVQVFANSLGFDLNQATRSRSEITNPAIVPIIAGFISVVDWIGSNQDFFPCVAECGTPPEKDTAKYWINVQNQAQKALETLGWLPAVAFANETHFDIVFPGFTPNALQKAAIELALKQTSPYLMIVEAPMGQGKTEAALFASDLAMCRGIARGMYIAMPTQATGNAMFRRVLDDYLKHRGHQGKLNLQLVHGDALLAQIGDVKEGEVQEFKPTNIGGDGDLEAQSWFTAKKRPLLSPLGVGTIDQSLLSVLQTKHWFVRLFGLAGKVVIFDEVHAYDAYMSTILERLLHWLAEVDCTVILLSATLPEAKRKTLVKAYSGRNDAEYKSYPRITLAKARHFQDEQSVERPSCKKVTTDTVSRITLQFTQTNLDSLTETLAMKLKNGGCVAVICNTVNRSIKVYKHLRDNLNDTECSLFHARTLRMWRREREEEVLRKFGKGEKQADGTYTNLHRPARAVLVATQVIEQSLDLDFDLMVSEIAPVDLLLQRCGRLHRHSRQRPIGLEMPLYILLCDAEIEGPPPESFGKSIEFVYDRYILLRTWFTLRGRKQIELPSDIEALVEAVYGELDMACDDNWNIVINNAKKHMEHDRGESVKSAGNLLICQPKCPCDLIEEFNDQLADDDDPQVHKTVRAATREGDPSITAVILQADTILSDDPNVLEVRTLLDQSTKLSHRGIFHSLLDNSRSPKEWARNAYLRHARLLRLNGQNEVRVGEYTLTVDAAIGIVIEKEGDING